MKKLTVFTSFLAAAVLGGCALFTPTKPTTLWTGEVKLEQVATSPRQWTGVAVSKTGRIFVNYPRWSDDVPVSVAEIRNGAIMPYPDETWQSWKPGDPDAATKFVCVQSVVVDDEDNLWILDPGSPNFAGVVPGAAKLIKRDLKGEMNLRTYSFAAPVINEQSYLNDVRIDTHRHVAYLTDSGTGAIIVLNLKTGAARRVLDQSNVTKSEGTTLTVEGKPWTRPDGGKPVVHSDGIALTRDGNTLYFHALTGNTLYRVPTAALRDEDLPPQQLADKVERISPTGAADGLEIGPDNRLYMTNLEHNAITRLRPDGLAETIITDPRLIWPDSLAFGPDGALYVNCSQINRMPRPELPFKLFKIVPKK